jgi:hypothetical protein
MAVTVEAQKSRLQEQEVAGVLQRIIAGERIAQRIGNWHMVARATGASPERVVTLNYLDKTRGNVFFEYDFEIKNFESKKEPLIFDNTHRRSLRAGYGTFSLLALQGVLQDVAQDIQRPIRLEFPEFEQADTAAWLKGMDYLLEERGVEKKRIYYKEIVPS